LHLKTGFETTLFRGLGRYRNRFNSISRFWWFRFFLICLGCREIRKNVQNETTKLFSTLCNLYFAPTQSHLLYGLLIWGATPKSCLKHLSVLQSKAIELIGNGRYREHVTPYYRKLNILKLSDLYHYETAKFMYLVLKNNFPPKLKYFFNYVNSVHSRTTRSAVSKKLSVPYYRLTKFQKSIAYQSIKIWNTVPDLHKKMSYRQFKDKYKYFLLQSYGK